MTTDDHRKRSRIWFVVCALNMIALGWIIGPDIGIPGGVFLFGTVVAAFKTGAETRSVDDKENE
jgi:hypothetical protein